MRNLAQLGLRLNKTGLELLREDRAFLIDILKHQRTAIQNAALDDYRLVWLKAADAEPVEHKKNNAGRRAANTFMRTVVWPSLSATTNRAA